jgi:CDP-glucose 4,6-dehydratase
MENEKELKKFWKGKKVFITGHTGFKGSWLVIFLNMLGAKIYGYSLPEKKNSFFSKIKNKNILKKNYYSNICNLNKLDRALRITKPEIIFHFAAQSLVSESFKNPYETFNTNFSGTLNVLNSIDKRYVKSIIITTTDKVYKFKNSNHKFQENDDLGGVDPYSASKVCVEILSNSYIKSVFKNQNLCKKISIVRAGNVLGGGDISKNRLVPDIIRSLNSKKRLIVRNPNHVRPWQHVIEPIYGYLLLAELQYKNKIKIENRSWNFGPKEKNFLKVKSIVEKFKSNSLLSHSFKNDKKISETKVLKLNSHKAKKNLKWLSKWDVDEIIKKILEWNDENTKKRDLIAISEKQIKEYLNK